MQGESQNSAENPENAEKSRKIAFAKAAGKHYCSLACIVVE
jgi:hypothetical protein